jgi:hypothetical protein
MFLTPSGRWIRRTVREDPLPDPMRVLHVDGTYLMLEDGRKVSLAGVALVDDPAARKAAAELMTVACEQGINILSDVGGGACIVRCEPRFYHWCGNDPIAAHFRQVNLNHVLIASGLAVFDESKAGSLSPADAQRLRDVEEYARHARFGRWSGDGTYGNLGAIPGHGLLVCPWIEGVSHRDPLLGTRWTDSLKSMTLGAASRRK